MPPTSRPAPSLSPQRTAGDRCPGALRLAEAADGHLARVRLPGGLITAGQLRALARLAAELGDGRAELTSRGNVQLRALPAGAAGRLTTELAAAGLLPSLDHDRVRNILASPLAGLDSGLDLAPVVAALDAGLCARPRLALLSGRFLFAIDDGRGDVASLGADIVATIGPDAITVNGLAVTGPASAIASPATATPTPDTTSPVTTTLSASGDSAHAVATLMLAFAEAFLDDRAAHGSTAWRIADLPGGADRIRGAVAHRLALAPATPAPVTSAPAATRPVGVIGRHAVLLAPLGRLTATQLDWLADQVPGRPARITPWRSVVLPDLADPEATLRAAAGPGFGVDAESPWLRVTACAGQPGCASALADVQADAASFASRWPGQIVHVSGCARHCGRPAATEIDVTATSEGYQIAGV